MGLFGGTFDPPHRAHRALAEVALQALALDELRWVPAGQPWQKARAVTPAVHREAMVRLAIAGEPRFVLDDLELRRSGPSYTVDTVEALAAERPQDHWFLVIGLDQWAGLRTWHRWRDLLRRVTLAVAVRPGVTAPDGALAGGTVVTLPLGPQDVSSTAIRARAALGLDLGDLVAPDVARYIDQHHLYRKDAVAH